MQADDSHEMPRLVFSEKKMSAANVTGALRVKCFVEAVKCFPVLDFNVGYIF